MSEKKPQRLGETLLAQGIITEDQLRIAIIEQKKQGEQLGKCLIRLGFVSAGTLRDALGRSLRQKSIDLTKAVPDPDALALVPLAWAKRYTLLPIACKQEEKILVLAMADTFNVVAVDQLSALLGGRFAIETVLAGESEIIQAIDLFYGFELSIDGILHEIETGEIDQTSLWQDQSTFGHPVVRLVDAILLDAVKRNASDIHLEPEAGFLRIRYRIDGVLRQIRSLHSKYWSAIVIRIKVISSLNIAETRAPQDGRVQMTFYGRIVDFRVSLLPTLYGENIVLRVLDRMKGILPIEELGLAEQELFTLQTMMAKPEGIILACGPTGSGKTTTLYSLLNAINQEGVNIMTLEDPVEYLMLGIRQSTVNEAARLTFATGIRAMMRQDPDVILVGEIRDEDTALMALRAAMTGHQVYATLHTNSALGAIPRLLDLGLHPGILAGSIIGIVAQRLIRRLCLKCRESYDATEIELRLLHAVKEEGLRLWRQVGCAACDYQGYKGRLALVEILPMTEDLDDAVATQAPMKELRAIAMSHGFCPMVNDAVRRLRTGVTSIDEVTRVINLTDRKMV
ncbi:MAG: type II/IV secretion system protein [Desulfobulbaceae bacterium]|nr:MAG: type II/IV secretion system protein [Desulfobulbaceae bacterium]